MGVNGRKTALQEASSSAAAATKERQTKRLKRIERVERTLKWAFLVVHTAGTAAILLYGYANMKTPTRA